MRKGEVRVNGIPAGVLEETETGFRFQYDRNYTQRSELPAGLLTEGVAMQLQCRMLKLDENDLFGRLLKTAQDDVIGTVTVYEISEDAS
jgi:serine/threonine-protein kinase HipA